jgi:hypothetical protein
VAWSRDQGNHRQQHYDAFHLCFTSLPWKGAGLVSPAVLRNMVSLMRYVSMMRYKT